MSWPILPKNLCVITEFYCICKCDFFEICKVKRFLKTTWYKLFVSGWPVGLSLPSCMSSALRSLRWSTGYNCLEPNWHPNKISEKSEERKKFFSWFQRKKIGNEWKSTVKPVYNDHPRDPKFVAVADRWLLFRGSFML